MEIIHAFGSLNALKAKGASVAIGAFDGVHAGHRALLNFVIKQARKEDIFAVAVTFDHPPRLFLRREQNRGCQLSTLSDKLSLMESLGMDFVCVLPFDNSLTDMSAASFIEDYLVRAIGLKSIVLGYDFRFGRGREGNLDLIEQAGKRFGFKVHTLDPLLYEGLPVSSTRIRQILAKGEIEEAARLLGRPYSFSGRVVKGSGRGRLLGVPTANLENIEVMLPRPGVYAAYALTDDQLRHKAALSMGDNPTFSKSFSVELHLLDFDADLYDRMLTITPALRLRDQARFFCDEELKAAITADIERTKKLLD